MWGSGPRSFTLVPGDSDSGDAQRTHSGTTAAEESTDWALLPQWRTEASPTRLHPGPRGAGNTFGMEEKCLCKHHGPPELSEGKRCSHRCIARSSPQPTAVTPGRKPGKLTGQVGGHGDAPCRLGAQGGPPDHHPCPRTVRRVPSSTPGAARNVLWVDPLLHTGSRAQFCLPHSFIAKQG